MRASGGTRRTTGAGMRSRLGPAVLGGYPLAAAWVMAVPVLWAAIYPDDPFRLADGVLIGSMSAFAVCALAVLWAFAAPTARHAWIGLLGPAFLLALMAGLGAP